MSADLHIHTTFSDGTNTPEEVIELAKKANLNTIAITDHDVVSGIGPAVRAGQKYGIEVIPGIEMTTDTSETEVHILGYFIDPANAAFLSVLKQIQQGRKDRIYKMVEKLKALGLKISAEEVFSLAGHEAPGRPHVARAMIKKGLVGSWGEAFGRYLKYGAPGYVGHYKLLPEDAIDLIKRAGGIAVFAHPEISACDDMIPKFVAAGIRGLEVYYPAFSAETVKHYSELAKKYGLLAVGGSDFHGTTSGRKEAIGSVAISDELVEKLKNEHLRGNKS